MKLTVLIPVYNTRPDYLLESVFSILNQTYKDFEILIINDGSTNEDTIKCLSFLRSIAIRVIDIEINSGISFALNVGINLSKTEYIARMDADDYSYPDRFQKQVSYLLEHPEVDVLGTQLRHFDAADPERILHSGQIHPEIITSLPENLWITNHGTVIYKKQSVIAAGLYDTNLRRAEDVFLWQSMFRNGSIFHNLPDFLYNYRIQKS